MNPANLKHFFNLALDLAKEHWDNKDYERVKEIYEILKMRIEEALNNLEVLLAYQK